MHIQWNLVTTMGLEDRDFNHYNRVCIHILIYFYSNSRDIAITEFYRTFLISHLVYEPFIPYDI
ncbi:hypothetical protein T4B_14627 [Trichinella pseudospiralis]|uniref:Uncharacterized protein n=2 Tax=Trichinella pseudospiralis TaxID=6337 RepID=A0A0V1FSE6_TRIPS|nr:hypothetical protein T4D_4321 [Trichinella pseudospiralis]KRZ27570.1 hypothetical protein T4B_14627 [Trichinella pseudospiralis]